MLQLGVVGCGNVTAGRHLPALQKCPGICVTALCDTDESRLNAVAGRFHIPHRFTAAAELLRSGRINAVAVCTPPASHAELACSALDAGLPLYLEKPIAPSVHEARAILAAAGRSAKPAIIGFNLRSHRLVEEAERAIAAGALGEIHLVRSVFTSNSRFNSSMPAWRLDPAVGGLLQEQAIHHFDLWRYLLGAEIGEVQASQSEDLKCVVLTAKTDGGALIHAGYSEATVETCEMDLFGTRAMMRLSLYEADGLEILPVGSQMGALGRRAARAGAFLRSVPNALWNARSGLYVDSYARRWCHFADCVAGKAAVNGTLLDGLRALEILVAAKESLHQRAPVALEAVR